MKNKSLIITYQKTVVKYLFNPKRNPCFVGQTYDSCYAECRIREFINRTETYPGDFLTNEVNSELKISRQKEAIDFVWSDNCDQFCSQFTDFYIEYFTVNSKPNLYNATAIEVPSHPTTIYEISLKMCFEEYLCLIASILSIWFGFSILIFSKFCEEFYRNLMNRKNINIFLITTNKMKNISNINTNFHLS